MTDQQPPADELAAVRAQLAALKEREAVLRGLMLTDPTARTGNRHVAVVKHVVVQRMDQKELRACHPSIAAEHTHAVTETHVELHEISEDGEVLPRRRKAQAFAPE